MPKPQYRYRIVINGVRRGPLSATQMRLQERDGSLEGDSPVWIDDAETPRPFGSIRDVIAAQAEAEAVVEEPEVQRAKPPMILTTGNEVAGRTVSEYLGIVRGVTVRSPRFGQDWAAMFQSLGNSGEIGAYAEVCEEARLRAHNLLVEHAAELGADAVIGLRYDATEFSVSCTEVLAYGTAVRLRSTRR